MTAPSLSSSKEAMRDSGLRHLCLLHGKGDSYTVSGREHFTPWNRSRDSYLVSFRNEKLPGKAGSELMRELVDDAVQGNPKQRPTMKEVVSRLYDIVNGPSSWKLPSSDCGRYGKAIPQDMSLQHPLDEASSFCGSTHPTIPNGPTTLSS